MSAAPARSPWLVGGVALVVVLVVGLWWAWPSVARPADRLDVVVVGDGQVLEARDPIERRIREEGFSVRTVAARGDDWCAAIDQLAELADEQQPSIVVLSPSSASATTCEGTDVTGTLRAAADAAGDATVVLLVQPGTADADTEAAVAALGATGITVADPTRLLPVGVERIGCQWWDDCESDGQVAVRDADGTLTPAGGERVARVLAGVLP